MTQLKTAYLLLGHDQPEHLAKLARALVHVDCVSFIHIDLKVDESIFRDSVGELSNLFFIKDRHVVNWGGFSQVQATLALLSAAFTSGFPFHRYCLLSGSDFPIKTVRSILTEFASKKEFIRVDRKIGASEDDSHSQNVMFYWFMDSPGPDGKARNGRVPREPYTSISLYHGAQWWALTHDCVDYIFRFLSDNTDYSEFFKHALCPDELFFHSIVKHSPFASRITHDFETAPARDRFFLSNEHGCHYIDWNAKGENRLPKVLDLADLDKLLNSGALFARKFKESRSAELLRTLEYKLNVDSRRTVKA